MNNKFVGKIDLGERVIPFNATVPLELIVMSVCSSQTEEDLILCD